MFLLYWAVGTLQFWLGCYWHAYRHPEHTLTVIGAKRETLYEGPLTGHTVCVIREGGFAVGRQ